MNLSFDDEKWPGNRLSLQFPMKINLRLLVNCLELDYLEQGSVRKVLESAWAQDKVATDRCLVKFKICPGAQGLNLPPRSTCRRNIKRYGHSNLASFQKPVKF